ncbi:MAG: PadR family transcriptional regulator [Lachnospiraceae bacterium]|jgi:DNA-binding PadR family transcriptional regulator|nr:PadR family transcriptional regulator [Lachnospiraceae bacterium]
MRDNIKGGALTETTFFILISLFQPSHGYKIMQFIKEETNGRLNLGAGTLYGALNTMLKKGWIKSYDGMEEKEDNSRTKEYIITEEGKSIARTELKRLRQVYQTGIKILEEVKDNE